MFYGDQFNQTLRQSSGVLKRITGTFFNPRSLLILAAALLIAFALGRFVAAISQRANKLLATRIDKAKNIDLVNKLRRAETLIVLTVALVRILLVILALFLWWALTHPNQRSGAILGASALFALILGGVLSPLLRDMAYGSVMMAEHWFGVSDHVTIEPFTLQGIVERVTLRATKIRSLNGETIWINNQNIAAMRITPKGVSAMAIELFVANLERGLQLIDATNLRLPSGPLMVISPLAIMTETKAADQLWHITAIGETAPERQWLLEKYAVEIMQELDSKSKHPVLLHDPIARFADNDAERRFARTISSNKKPKVVKRTIRSKTLIRNAEK